MEETRIEKVYKKFADIKKEAENDCSFNKLTMENAFSNSSLISKWITKKMEWTRVLRDLDLKRKKAYRDRYEFYQTDYPLKLSTKEEMNLFIETDEAYVESHNLCMTIKEVIGYIDSTIDALKTRGFEIKNFIEWEKFKNGK